MNLGRDVSELNRITKKISDYTSEEQEYFKVLAQSNNEKIFEITGCIRIP